MPAPPPTAAAAPPAAFASSFGSLDLPAPKPAAPPAGGRTFGSVDLPASKTGGGTADLPSLPGGGFGDLPVVQPVGAGLPAAKGGGFGELDLPSLQNDLPLHSGLGNNLPAAAHPGAHLPAPTGPGAHLPTAMGAGQHLPTAMGAGQHLPTAMGGNAHLPSAMGAGAHLPTAMGGNAHLPSAMDAGAHLPSAMGDDRLLPNRAGPAPVSFGEIDLPLVGAGSDAFGVAPPPPPRPLDAGGFGEVDLPADNSGGMGIGMGGGLPPLPAQPQGGGLGFGEVDLGGGGADLPPIAPPVAMSAGSLAFQEASLDAGPKSGPSPGAAVPGRLRERARDSGPPSKALRIAAIAVAAIVVGGAALQLTSVGAFGHVWITDRLHSGENAQMAREKGDFARKKLALDTFASAQQAADDLVDARKKAPRSRPLGAYAAFVEYTNQVRFGNNPARAAHVSTFITDIPADVDVSYLAAARAAQAAQSSDWAKAKSLVDVAIAKEPKDGIQHELSILKGEIALAQKDPTAALAAFNAAHVSGGSARTYFGIARAHFMAKAFPKAREAVDATLKASPAHNGALTLRAQLLWDMQRDDASATKDLAAVLDEKNRKNLGVAELATALTTKGWIMLARDRMGEARMAFDEAVKVDPRNVTALVGQGEVLYADSRFTEALSRFGEALNKDPNSVAAIVGSAKSKVSLEQLADAKTQLQAARQKAPKEMIVALWLARVEDALGNKKPAEELYGIAIDLATPENPDSIQAYAQYAKYLAAQGKAAEAAAKMDQAKAKLPDSAALQRALGEVADTQGQFAEAIEHYENALEKNQGDLGTRFRLGMTYLKMHKLDLAAKALDEVAAIDKEYPGLSLQRGILLEESGDLTKALEQFNGALQKQPDDPDLMLRVGAAYVSIGEIDKAFPLLNKVREARPNSAEANHFLGRAYLRQGGLDQTQALRYLQRAVALDPNKAEYHLYVAWAANDASQLGLARAEIEKALALDKLLADAYWQRGVLLRKESQVNDAIKDLKHALELKPSRLEAHAALAEAYENKNDTAAAISEWQKAIAGNDKIPYWRWQYGKLLSNKNAYAEAAGHLYFAVEEGKKLQPRPAWVMSAAFESGEAHQKTGKKKEACEGYRFYLDTAPPGAADRRDAERGIAALACPTEN
ncbi:MAG: tetratricopeptide repeat protein [Labilithrix sp.]|nr:tetratricopeptide repeat protein [Labilithrix sp.]